LLNVWNPPVPGGRLVRLGPLHHPARRLDELEQFSLERAQAIVKQGQELCARDGFVVEPRVERSGPSLWRTIRDVAADLNADLIVVGTARCATAVQSALLGSVLKRGRAPLRTAVLVVPDAAPEQAHS